MKTLVSAVRSRLFKAVRERHPDCLAVELLCLFSYTSIMEIQFGTVLGNPKEAGSAFFLGRDGPWRRLTGYTKLPKRFRLLPLGSQAPIPIHRPPRDARCLPLCGPSVLCAVRSFNP